MANGDEDKPSWSKIIGDAILNNLIATIFAGLLFIAGSIWVGVHWWLSYQAVAAVVADLKDNQNSALQKILSETIDRSIKHQLSSIVGITLGDRVDLTVKNPLSSFPLIVPLDHKVWLLYRIETDLDIRNLSVEIDGQRWNKKLKVSDDTSILPLSDAIGAAKKARVDTLTSQNGIVISSDQQTSNRLEDNLYNIGFGIDEKDLARLSKGADRDGKITISYVLLVSDTLNLDMIEH